MKDILKALADRCDCEDIQCVSEFSAGGLNQSAVFKTDRGKFFVKKNSSYPLSMYEAELKGLEAIQNTKTLKTPISYCCGQGDVGIYFIMEYLELIPHDTHSQLLLGEQLAKMHSLSGKDKFGFELDNTIGTTPQLNSWQNNWITFFLEDRLEFQLKLIEKNYRDTELRRAAEPLLTRFPSFFSGIEVSPSLLHGDLWSGNTAQDRNGCPVVYDPAAYYGHHEAEFGILLMFGGFFFASFFEAYHAVLPKEAGFEERHQAYKLYHMLNHYNLFGSAYRAGCLSICDYF